MKPTNKVRILSVILSLMMVLSLISIPALKTNAAGGVDGFVERCYTVTLGRGSDAAGFADWKDQLLNGKSVGVNIAYGFLFSKEYINKKKSNEDYVKDLYKLFMDREPDEAGFNDWVGKLNEGKSRQEVFAGFANSQEFYNVCESYGITAGYFVVGYDRNQVNNVNLFVERLYQTCLGRRGDRDGQKDWVNKLVKKEITGVECARCFIQSKEYTNKGLNDDQFVENLYKAFMGRSSDAEGKANWTYALKNGMTRDEVFAGFANSKEFDDICKKYGISRGSYTAKDKGTYDPNKQQNNNQNNNTNNNNQNNNTNNENQNNNGQNNNQNSNEENNTPKQKTGYYVKKINTTSRHSWAGRDDDGEWKHGFEYKESYTVFTYNDKTYEYPESSETFLKETGEYERGEEYEFDSNGFPTKCINYTEENKVYEYYDITCDSAGRITEQKIYDNKDKYSGKYVYEFNDKGEMIKSTEYDKTDEVKYITVFTYDSAGKKTGWNQYRLDGSLAGYTTFEYDSTGNCIREEFYVEDLLYYYWIREYDDKGNMIIEQWYCFEYLDPTDEKVLLIENRYEYGEYTYYE